MNRRSVAAALTKIKMTDAGVAPATRWPSLISPSSPAVAPSRGIARPTALKMVPSTEIPAPAPTERPAASSSREIRGREAPGRDGPPGPARRRAPVLLPSSPRILTCRVPLFPFGLSPGFSGQRGTAPCSFSRAPGRWSHPPPRFGISDDAGSSPVPPGNSRSPTLLPDLPSPGSPRPQKGRREEPSPRDDPFTPQLGQLCPEARHPRPRSRPSLSLNHHRSPGPPRAAPARAEGEPLAAAKKPNGTRHPRF